MEFVLEFLVDRIGTDLTRAVALYHAMPDACLIRGLLNKQEEIEDYEDMLLFVRDDIPCECCKRYVHWAEIHPRTIRLFYGVRHVWICDSCRDCCVEKYGHVQVCGMIRSQFRRTYFARHFKLHAELFAVNFVPRQRHIFA